MSAAIAAVACALVAGPLMWFLRRFDARNTAQHADNHRTLQSIDAKLDHHDAKLDRLDDKLGRHIDNPRGHR